MMRRIFWVVILALVLSAVLPIRLAAKLPTAERLDADQITAATSGEELSLARILHLTGQEDLLAISAYVYGLPADRLALSQGLDEPTCVTVYFDGIRYLGATTTFDGAGEYFDLSGRSAQQLDEMTDEQYLASKAQTQKTLEEKTEQLSQNLHNFIMNVESWN